MRSVEEIVSESLERHGVSLVELRGHRQSDRLKAARGEALVRVWKERPDLSSGEVGRYFNREGSSVRHMLTRRGALA
jgi:chromosomal replication initiation ATPase DnaA